MKIAVVILNYNGKHYLEQFLQNTINHSPHVEVIIADNASTDDSIQYLDNNFPQIKTIKLDKNYGFAGGYNQALQQIKSDYYILLNSDIEVTNNWIQPLVSFMDAHPEYAACQPKILDYHNKDKFEYAGASGGFIDKLGYPYCRGRVFDTIEVDNGQYDEPIDIFWATGACLFIRSQRFWEAGGFDEDFFAHMEEIDLAWRIQNNGHKLKCLPKSTVYHIGGGTLAKSNPFKTYLNFRNNLCMLLKNLPLRRLTMVLPFRILLDWLAALILLIQKKPKDSISIFKSQYYLIKHLKRILKKRKSTQSIKLEITSILYLYHFRKKKTFQSIIPKRIISSS